MTQELIEEKDSVTTKLPTAANKNMKASENNRI